MTMIIVSRDDFDGSKMGINGKVIDIPLGVAFDASAEIIEVLNNARVPYTFPASGGLTSYISITPLGRSPGFVPLGINGRLRYLMTGVAFVPSSEELDAIKNSQLRWRYLYDSELSGGTPTPTPAPPSITSGSSTSVAENAVLAFALTSNQTVTWSIVAGGDAASMEVSGSTLRFAGNGTADFETKNSYSFTVQALNTTSGLSTTQAFSLAVTDQDEIPSAFSFADVTDATVSTVYTSNTITVAGLGSGVSTPASITGGTYSKNGGGYTSAAGTAVNGDTFAVRVTSDADEGDTVSTTLTIGGVSDTYTVTTESAATPTTLTFDFNGADDQPIIDLHPELAAASFSSGDGLTTCRIRPADGRQVGVVFGLGNEAGSGKTFIGLEGETPDFKLWNRRAGSFATRIAWDVIAGGTAEYGAAADFVVGATTVQIKTWIVGEFGYSDWGTAIALGVTIDATTQCGIEREGDNLYALVDGTRVGSPVVQRTMTHNNKFGWRDNGSINVIEDATAVFFSVEVEGAFIPNPQTPPTTISSSSATGILDTESEAHFIKSDTGGVQRNWRFGVNVVDEDKGWFYERLDDDGFRLRRKDGGVFYDIGPWSNLTAPQNWNLYNVLEGRVETDGALGLYGDDELIPGSSIPNTSVNTLQPGRGTNVSFDALDFWPGNPSPAGTNIVYGTGGVSLRIPDIRYDIENNWFEIDILYSDTPTGFKYTLNNGAEFAAVKIANPTAGEATLRTEDIGGAVGAISVKVILDDDPDINKTAIITVPAPAQFGMNLTPISPYGFERVYTNLLLGSYWQDTSLLDNPDAKPGSAHINMDGEPISDANGSYNPSGYLSRPIARPDTPGSVVRIEWDGEATISLLAGSGTTVTGETSGTGWHQFTYGHDWTGLSMVFMRVSGINPANHMRNIVACEPGRDPVADVFTPEYIARCQEVHGPKRLMDLMAVNGLYLFEGDWEDRTPEGRLNPNEPYGMSISRVIELINQIGDDVWINTPPFASDDYILNFFNALNDGVDDGITIYAEVGNEWGNASFMLFHTARQKAYDNGRATFDEYTNGGGAEAVRNEQVYQHQRQMTILDSIGAASGRFVRVITAMGTSNELDLVTTRGATRTDAICNAPYFGSGLDNAWFDESLDDIFIEARRMMNETMDNYAVTAAAYKAAGLRAIIYEGQQHVILTPGYTPTQEAQFLAFQYDDRMRVLIKDYMLRHASDNGDVMCFYSSIGEAGAQYGAWGAKRNQNATLGESPKWAGFLEAQAAI